MVSTTRIRSLDDFLSLLQGVTKQRDGEYMALCPGHDDHNPSLGIILRGQTILMKCYAGCETEKTLAAMGLTKADLFLEKYHEPPHAQRKEVAVYKYQDFEVVRYDPKGFAQRRPGRNGSYIWNLDGVTRTLYHQNELPAAIEKGTIIFIAEGEKDIDRLLGLGLTATCNPGGAGKWLPQYTTALKGADLVIIPDNDKAGKDHAAEVAKACHGIAAGVRILELPGPGKDVSDWLDNDGCDVATLQALAAACPTWDLPSSPVSKHTDNSNVVSNDGARPIPLMTMPGAELLDQVTGFLLQYVVLTRAQANTLALWVAHTHAFEAAEATPYISITSPEKRSGKTRLLEVLELVVNRPWLTGRVTPAVLARKVDKDEPTLLLDESDAAFNGDKEYAETLRGILNTGHRRGGKASVCTGQGANISFKDLSTFCPKAIAGIGKLPDTVSDRSITIILKRRTASEFIERFRRKKAEIPAQVLKDNLAALAVTLKLAGAEPDLPLELDDRAADSWEPLLAIADAVGGDWPNKARAAAIDLSCGGIKDDQSLGIRLLADIKAIFTDKQADRLPSAEIVQELNAMEDAPWVDLGHKPLTANKMARLLKPYGIGPKTMRIGQPLFKGYLKEDFADVWNRYAPPLSGISSVTSVTPAMNHDHKLKVTIQENRETVSDGNYEQLSYDVTDVTDKRPEGAGAAVNDTPPERIKQKYLDWKAQQSKCKFCGDAAGDCVCEKKEAAAPADVLEQWEIAAGVTLGPDGERIIGSA